MTQTAEPGPRRQRALDRLTREFDRLSTQQCEAMKRAIFLGMTSDEASDYDERHHKIAALVKKIGRLPGATHE